jgi:hypothetical protein
MAGLVAAVPSSQSYIRQAVVLHERDRNVQWLAGPTRGLATEVASNEVGDALRFGHGGLHVNVR